MEIDFEVGVCLLGLRSNKDVSVVGRVNVGECGRKLVYRGFGSC